MQNAFALPEYCENRKAHRILCQMLDMCIAVTDWSICMFSEKGEK